MDEDEEEDYHHSGSDRVSTSGRCKGIFLCTGTGGVYYVLYMALLISK